MSWLADMLGAGVVWDIAAGVLDIAIVAYVVYRVLLVIKDTRAFQVLIGVLLLALVYLASLVLSLHTLKWIFDRFFPYLVLILIILFQDDIRRGLARVGTLPFFKRAASVEYLGELVKAVGSMAKRKIGALIVIERETKLKTWLESGIIIDAKVTREVINSIFLPTSPIHDGAVVIRRGRLLAAGVILPLTQDPRISKALGTRHRAAIGISEVSDAIAIVVSEEDGSISMVESGTMKRDIEASELREMINEAFRAAVEEELDPGRAPVPAPTPLGEKTTEVATNPEDTRAPVEDAARGTAEA